MSGVCVRRRLNANASHADALQPLFRKQNQETRFRFVSGWNFVRLTSRLMLAGFRAADHEFAAEEFFVVQFLHRSFRFFDGLHLHKGETLGALVMPVTYDLGVLHVADAIE
jgi:hypothetical protein